LGGFTALTVLFALVVPFAGTALAQHVSGITITPSSDTAPANTCNAFTVTLTGPTMGQDTNPGVEGETVDIRVTDTDTDDNAAVNGGANESDIIFCTPPATAAGVEESGPNPRMGVNGQPGDDNLTDDNTTNQLNGEVGTTDVNGQITFGITSSEAGNFSVLVFFDENNNDNPAGEFTASATKTFGAPPATGNQGVSTLDCEPETDTNPEGTTHSFNCTASDANGNRVSGANVVFDVTAGPNAEEVPVTNCNASTTNNNGNTTVNQPPSNTTTSNGQVTCSYTDTEQSDTATTTDNSPPGTDTIVAFVQQTPPVGQQGSPGADSFEPQDTITKTFVGDANNIDCTAPASARAGSIVTITCTVTDEVGQPVPNVNVSFTNDGAGVFRQFQNTTGFCTTNANGVCSVQVETNESEEGEDVVVTASIQDFTGDINGNSGPNQADANGFTGDTNCNTSNTGQSTPQTGTNANCTDTVTVALTGAAPPPPPPPLAECEDGVDNDNDGFIDFPNDRGCSSGSDDSENTDGGGGGGGDTVGSGPCQGRVEGSRENLPNGGQVIVGTSGSDILIGTDGNDIICGLAGDDIIDGGGGDDKIVGNAGDDTIDGGGGKDQIGAGGGKDSVDGGNKNDVITGGGGNDQLRGNKGFDTLRGGGGDDTLQGGRGDDILRGGKGNDTLKGFTGKDLLNGGPGTDTCSGGPGRNVIKNCERRGRR
jgi:Ca2+-binding RTX toxin-like protein